MLQGMECLKATFKKRSKLDILPEIIAIQKTSNQTVSTNAVQLLFANSFNQILHSRFPAVKFHNFYAIQYFIDHFGSFIFQLETVG